MTDLSKYEAEAHALGVEAAKSAASWCTDGNTSEEHYRRVLALMNDGDPRVEEYLPAYPDLSGEWSDSPTPQSLAADILGADWETHGYNAPDMIPSELVDAIANAWEEGVSETFEPECERLMRGAIEHERCMCPDDCNCRHAWRTNFCGCQQH
jgi:hypothetical protein